jgi:hypothetical protein
LLATRSKTKLFTDGQAFITIDSPTVKISYKTPSSIRTNFPIDLTLFQLYIDLVKLG